MRRRRRQLRRPTFASRRARVAKAKNGSACRLVVGTLGAGTACEATGGDFPQQAFALPWPWYRRSASAADAAPAPARTQLAGPVLAKRSSCRAHPCRASASIRDRFNRRRGGTGDKLPASAKPRASADRICCQCRLCRSSDFRPVGSLGGARHAPDRPGLTGLRCQSFASVGPVRFEAGTECVNARLQT